jgi:hypothetical protein
LQKFLFRHSPDVRGDILARLRRTVPACAGVWRFRVLLSVRSQAKSAALFGHSSCTAKESENSSLSAVARALSQQKRAEHAANSAATAAAAMMTKAKLLLDLNENT